MCVHLTERKEKQERQTEHARCTDPFNAMFSFVPTCVQVFGCESLNSNESECMDLYMCNDRDLDNGLSKSIDVRSPK